jgi:hypothetical protein
VAYSIYYAAITNGKLKYYTMFHDMEQNACAECIMSNPFSFLQHVRSNRGDIYIKVIENKQDNCGDHDEWRKTKVISPPGYVHKLAHKD